MTATWKAHMKGMENFFWHNPFSVRYMTWMAMENTSYTPKSHYTYQVMTF